MATAREPAEVIYRACVDDMLTAIGKAAASYSFNWIAPLADPAYINATLPTRQALGRLEKRWEQACATPGVPGERQRVTIAMDAAKQAIATHESLPGAPPAPAWLVDLTKTRGELAGPRPVYSYTDAVGDTLGDYADAFNRAGKGLARPFQIGLAVATAAVLVGGALWVARR